eukprot:CAMPEP_0198725384 /NCGR_PEP_ID=MMETSP1475-20131203/2700_1 /TAXON_ID= ORGANISM="Unidentified sp., Strain CCMP1999" /NCGR_SAMPLE_ID=MMETSP1475 /ASSEMBLY_ACC=CAM_ASM_001111 /LENGTH=228 /DNA_ID=CAMNT_0044487149 /DNA_START=375 /DNA_END=1063 /DNA_ORIENTATION=-
MLPVSLSSHAGWTEAVPAAQQPLDRTTTFVPHDTKDPAECVEVEVDLSRVSGVVVRKEVTTGREKRSKPDILCHSKKSALHVVERCAHCMQRVFSQEEVVRPKRLVDLRKGQDTIPVAVHLHERARYARDEIVNADKFLKVDRPAAIHVVHTKQQRADVLRHLQPRLAKARMSSAASNVPSRFTSIALNHCRSLCSSVALISVGYELPLSTLPHSRRDPEPAPSASPV